MTEMDREPLSRLLAKGFPAKDAEAWSGILSLLLRLADENGLPAPGFVLDAEGTLVGTLLTILKPRERGPAQCNLSSWYVEPDYRSYAPLLVAAATRDKGMSYVNVSSQRHTRPTIEAQGFRRYADGLHICFPLLALGAADGMIVEGIEAPEGAAVDDLDRAVMRDHRDLDLLALWCVSDGCAYPFLFLPRRITRLNVPVAHLAFCRDVSDAARFARPLGRFLARRGYPALLVDANGPIPGLPGRFFPDRMPKYARGPVMPRIGDLSYTEAAFFGA